MIKLKDILLENQSPNLLIPRRVEGRVAKMIQQYIKNGSKGDLYLTDMKLTKLPDVLKYVDVSGDFSCDDNKLTSLIGAPKSVSGDFYCHNNQLTSLDNAPKSVSGDFVCYNNLVEFTEEQVKEVCNVKGSITV